MPFLLILLTRSRYRRLSRLLSIYHAETVSSSRNLLVAAYTLYYHTTPAVETHLLQRYTHHLMTSCLYTRTSLCFLIIIFLFSPLLHFYIIASVLFLSTIYSFYGGFTFISYGSRHYFVDITPLTGTSPHPAHHTVQTHTKRQTWGPSTPSRTSSTLPPIHHSGTASSSTTPRL
jgi:hypothetical protein